MAANVLQHQFGISSLEKGGVVLRTNNVLICTALVGYCSMTKIAFLCHFDMPWSARSLRSIVDDLMDEVAGRNHDFKAFLVGGKQWVHSPITRKLILKQADSLERINLTITPDVYDNWSLIGRSISINPSDGVVSYEKVSGPSAMHGFGWAFKPMVRSTCHGC